ncbi:putative n-acetylglucosamine-6-phosphate deacetylase [Diplocarpon rosae]|nr:putative n-acetylglucosamine-6-phosphate deacetylase [Diplocarpon rosae]
MSMMELAGLPDGIHPGCAQTPSHQLEALSNATIERKGALVTTCSWLDECLRNSMASAEMTVTQAVRCVTGNIANAMGLKGRGSLERKRQRDFITLIIKNEVKKTSDIKKKADFMMQE